MPSGPVREDTSDSATAAWMARRDESCHDPAGMGLGDEGVGRESTTEAPLSGSVDGESHQIVRYHYIVPTAICSQVSARQTHDLLSRVDTSLVVFENTCSTVSLICR